MSLVSLKRTPAEMAADARYDMTGEQEPYAWGTRITLCAEELTKLGIGTLPEIGAEMGMTAVVQVISVSQSSTMTSDDRSVTLQITQMDLRGESDLEPKSLAQKMYPMTHNSITGDAPMSPFTG